MYRSEQMVEMMDRITEEILLLIQERCRQKSRIIVAIDGRCAAGKTTLADSLRKSLDCSVIHMDHFFLRSAQRTEERLRTAGGNIDHERFIEEVLHPLEAGIGFSYRPYDCREQAFGEPVVIRQGAVCVIEGSYACHPALREHYDLRIFLDISPAQQMQRILLRDGAEKAEVFRARWIPMEEHYFSGCMVKECCHRIFDCG